jgi:serine/threonine-protein kinase
MRVGPLDYKRAARYVEEVAQQLVGLHEAGQTHRNVRPGSIFLNEQGMARIVSSVDVNTESATDLVTDDTSELADFLAPELALSAASVDGRADIYGLGCTLYFLLTARPPFATGPISERLLKHQTAMPDDTARFRPDAPQPLITICTKMMAKNPAERHQTASDVVNALTAWRNGAAIF